MARLGLAAVLAALIAACGATTATAAAPDVWATVNVCDTAKHPNAIGVRASMPGARRQRVRLYMRFRVQWKDPADGLWHNLIDEGDSGYIAVGRPKHGARRQGGYQFRFQAPDKPLRAAWARRLPVADRQARGPQGPRAHREGSPQRRGERPRGVLRRDVRPARAVVSRRTGAGRWR